MINDPEEYPPARPWPVTIGLVFVLCMTTWNGIRAWTVIANWDLLSRFRANPIYTFVTGIICLILGIAFMIILLKGSRVTPACGLVLSILYVLWYWIDRLTIQLSPESNITFSIVVSIVGLVIFNIFLFWPSSRAFFKEIQ
jgi:hypothetical protein